MAEININKKVVDVVFKKFQEKTYQNIMNLYRDSLISINDLFGDGYSGLSGLFYIFNKRYLYWLDNDPDIAISEKEIMFRRKFYRVLQIIGPYVMKCTQIFENRQHLNALLANEEDDRIILPDKPVIFVANHSFHDDDLATVLAAGRPAYPICGGLPLLYNTVDGLAVSMVGGICVNRKSKDSKKA